MKTIILTLALALSALFAKAQTNEAPIAETEGITIKVSVLVPNDEGSVLFGLYDESTFMKAAPLQGLEGEIIDGKSTVTFTKVLPGTYGITLFHDKNSNKTMDFEPNGMPIEMYGASNNVMTFGPPLWNDAKFEVGNEPIEMEIRM